MQINQESFDNLIPLSAIRKQLPGLLERQYYQGSIDALEQMKIAIKLSIDSTEVKELKMLISPIFDEMTKGIDRAIKTHNQLIDEIDK